MDLSPFKRDIDELIKEFAERELKTLADMKKLWLDRKFSYIFVAQPSTNLAVFMQSLYNHSMSYLIFTNSLSQRLGALYCLYCLYETQPFKPQFKIYFSLGELRSLKALVVDAKEKGIKVVCAVVKRMLEKNAFLFGFVDINDYSEKERIKELVDVQNACIQKMREKLLSNTEIERYLHMDMGMELDLKVLMKMSKEYEGTKSLAIREASGVVDVQNITHIAEDRATIGDIVRKIIDEWSNQKEIFSQQTVPDQHLPAITHPEQREREQEQLMLLPAAEQQLSDDESLPTGFMELLLGNKSPHSVPQIQEEQQDDELEYAVDLEHLLFDDVF